MNGKNHNEAAHTPAGAEPAGGGGRVWASLAYLFAFAGALVLAALSINLTVAQPVSGLALIAAGLALLACLPGLIKERLYPVSLVLGVIALYVLWRVAMPLPSGEPGSGMNFLEQHVYYGQALRLGLAAYRQDVYPLTLEGAPGLQLLVLTVWYGVAWFAAFLGVARRRPLMGMGVLGAVMGVTCSINAEKEGLWLAVGFLVLFGGVLALTRSGIRKPSSPRFGPQSAVLGLGIAAVAAFGTLGLLAVAPTMAAPGLPRLSAWDPLHPTAEPEIVFNWRQNYPLLLDPGRNYPIMEVASPVPAYWRANVLEVFTGDSWVSRGSFLIPVGEGAGQRVVPRSEEPAPGKAVAQVFTIDGVHTAYLFTGGYPTQLGLDDPTRVFSSSAMALRAEKSLGPQFSYTLSVIVPQVKPEDLVGLGRDYPSEVQELYLGTPLSTVTEAGEAVAPSGDFEGIYALNERMIGEAQDPYEIALRVEQYLRVHYMYTLSPPPSTLRSPYAAFLLDTHKGYCQHFAGAMALMLRLNEIPARVAVGFVTGEEIEEDLYQVTTNNAHAWVEVYFPGYGWLPFDPTPGQSLESPGVSSASAGFVDPYPEPPTTTTTTPAADATAPAAAGTLPPEGPPPGAEGDAAAATRNKFPPLLASVLALVGVLLAWPAGVAVGRDLPTRFGSPDQRLRATTRRLLGDLAAWGLAPSSSATLDEVAGLVESRVGVNVWPLVDCVQGVAFGEQAAAERDVRDARSRAALVRRRLRAVRGWLPSLRAWYGIPVSRQEVSGQVTVSGAAGERWGERKKGRVWQ